MNRTHARWIVCLAAILGAAWAPAGLAQEPGRKAGEKVDEVGRDIKGGLRKAGSATKDAFSRTRTSVHNMGVESRVYSRLHWDKALNEALIELSAGDDGVIILDGTVADDRAKRRAVELAQDTLGVARVVDRLAVRQRGTIGP
jgi:hyperosmotically inducible protein